jgi:non-specific serine/threonine protein kinase
MSRCIAGQFKIDAPFLLSSLRLKESVYQRHSFNTFHTVGPLGTVMIVKTAALPRSERRRLGRERQTSGLSARRHGMTGTADTSSLSFSVLLRRYRENAGLSQEELAERAGLTGQAISVLERGERRYPYPATVRRLADALGLADGDRATLLAAVPPRSRGRTSAPGGVATDRAALPQDGRRTSIELPDLPAPLTRPLGREDDLARASELLHAGTRLLTLTGPGGVGKTRLALQIAAELRPYFADGVVFVSLAALASSGLVLPTIAQVLGVRDTGSEPLGQKMARSLRERHLLLVLDNCEHVLAGVAEISSLLEACPRLVVLATSRASLQIHGEQEYPVEPLTVPGFDNAPTLEEAARSPAVRLFVERAQAASPGFALTEENASAVAAICGRLDGLPLALELAAPRLKLLSPAALLARLHHALPLLTGGGRDAPARQQTLRDTIAWSYGLLDAREQALFRRFSVFAGGCTLEAAETVCFEPKEGETEVIAGLGSLLDKSLLQVGEDGDESRFAALQTIREFAQEELEASGEAGAIREQHARYFLRLAEAGVKPLQALPPDYFPRLESEQDNLRAAMDWARDERQVELGLRLVCAHYNFWLIQGHCTEGQQRAEELLAIPGPVDPRLRSRAVTVAGSMARLRGDLGRALELVEQALALARETGDGICIAFACQQLGIAAGLAGDLRRARILLEESLALTREANSPYGIAMSTHLLARLTRQEGQLDQAETLWRESLSLFRELGDLPRIALVLSHLADMAGLQGDLERAKALALASLSPAVEVGYAVITLSFLELMAPVAVGEGEAAMAARFLGAAEVARAESGEAFEPEEQELWQRTVETGRAQLGEAEWERAYQEGRGLPLEEALALARAYAAGQTQRGETDTKGSRRDDTVPAAADR